MFMMRLMMQIFTVQKWIGTLVRIHEEGNLPSFSVRHAGRQSMSRNGCEPVCTFRTYSVSCILENASIKCFNSTPCPDALLVSPIHNTMHASPTLYLRTPSNALRATARQCRSMECPHRPQLPSHTQQRKSYPNIISSSSP